jgi:uncharacterized protein (DUF1330 family)
MAVYVVADIVIRDEAAKTQYAEYIRQVRPIVEKFGGRYLVRGGGVTPLVGDWNPERLIIIEFPSADHVCQWWNSPEYKAITGLRENNASADVIIVEGSKE